MALNRLVLLLTLSALLVACGQPSAAPHPIIGKWRQISDDRTSFDFLSDGKLILRYGSGESANGIYEILSGDRLQVKLDYQSQGPFGHYSQVSAFKITGDRLLTSIMTVPPAITFVQGQPVQSKPGIDDAKEYQRVSISPTVVSAVPAPTKSPPAATTEAAAATRFFQALLAGDVSGALSQMTLATQSKYSSKLPGMALALAPCTNSVMEVPFTTTFLAEVQFTPPCGDLRAAYLSIFPELAKSAPQSRPVRGWWLFFEPVGVEWKVAELQEGF